jgi:hypothetical protein
MLRAALDNLDVQLEEELLRYRRQRRLKPESIPRWGYAASQRVSSGGFRNRSARGTVQLPDVNNPPPPSVTHSVVLAAEKHLAAAKPSSRLQVPSAVADYPKSDRSQSQFLAASPLSASLAIASEANLDLLSHAPSMGIASYSAQDHLSTVASEGVGESNVSLQTIASSNTPSDHPEAPEDYLESSEELLKSIAEEDPELRAEQGPSLLDLLLTPLGVGSMFLLLLSSATLGYIIMNPSSLGDLASKVASSSSGKQPTDANVSTVPIDSPPPSPDLAADEFVDLNLNNLSTLPDDAAQKVAKPTSPKPGATSSSGDRQSQVATLPLSQVTQPLPSVVIPSQSSSSPSQSAPQPVPVTALPKPASSIPSVQPAPAAVPVSPAPASHSAPASQSAPAHVSTSSAPASPVAAASSSTAVPSAPRIATAPAAHSSAPQSYYYVVTDYNGDPSLERARQAVPDAYVRNLPTGAKVQLGAFSNEAAAQERIQELAQKGVSAQIYQP